MQFSEAVCSVSDAVTSVNVASVRHASLDGPTIIGDTFTITVLLRRNSNLVQLHTFGKTDKYTIAVSNNYRIMATHPTSSPWKQISPVSDSLLVIHTSHLRERHRGSCPHQHNRLEGQARMSSKIHWHLINFSTCICLSATWNTHSCTLEASIATIGIDRGSPISEKPCTRHFLHIVILTALAQTCTLLFRDIELAPQPHVIHRWCPPASHTSWYNVGIFNRIVHLVWDIRSHFHIVCLAASSCRGRLLRMSLFTILHLPTSALPWRAAVGGRRHQCSVAHHHSRHEMKIHTLTSWQPVCLLHNHHPFGTDVHATTFFTLIRIYRLVSHGLQRGQVSADLTSAQGLSGEQSAD